MPKRSESVIHIIYVPFRRILLDITLEVNRSQLKIVFFSFFATQYIERTHNPRRHRIGSLYYPLCMFSLRMSDIKMDICKSVYIHCSSTLLFTIDNDVNGWNRKQPKRKQVRTRKNGKVIKHVEQLPLFTTWSSKDLLNKTLSIWF